MQVCENVCAVSASLEDMPQCNMSGTYPYEWRISSELVLVVQKLCAQSTLWQIVQAIKSTQQYDQLACYALRQLPVCMQSSE